MVKRLKPQEQTPAVKTDSRGQSHTSGEPRTFSELLQVAKFPSGSASPKSKATELLEFAEGLLKGDSSLGLTNAEGLELLSAVKGMIIRLEEIGHLCQPEFPEDQSTLYGWRMRRELIIALTNLDLDKRLI